MRRIENPNGGFATPIIPLVVLIVLVALVGTIYGIVHFL